MSGSHKESPIWALRDAVVCFFELLKRKIFSKSNLFSWANELSLCLTWPYHVKRLHYGNKTIAREPLPFCLCPICHYLFSSGLSATPDSLGLVINRTDSLLPSSATFKLREYLSLLEQPVIWIKDVSSNSKTLRQMWLKADIFLI